MTGKIVRQSSRINLFSIGYHFIGSMLFLGNDCIKCMKTDPQNLNFFFYSNILNFVKFCMGSNYLEIIFNFQLLKNSKSER